MQIVTWTGLCEFLWQCIASELLFCMHLFPSCDLLDSCSALFVFKSGLLCVLAMLAATFWEQLGNTPTSFHVGKGQHTLLRRPPAQSLCPHCFLCGNAVKLFSYHSQSISEASNSGALIRLSSRSRSGVMVPVGARQEEWSWARLLHSRASFLAFPNAICTFNYQPRL